MYIQKNTAWNTTGSAMFIGLVLMGILLGLWMGYKGTILPFVLLPVIFVFILSLERPYLAVLLFVAIQILVPIYAGLPLIPGLPPLPPAFFLFLLISGAMLVRLLLAQDVQPSLPLMVRLLVAASFLVVLVGLLSVLAGGADRININLWVRAFVIPFIIFLIVIRVASSSDRVYQLFNVLLATAVIASLFALVEFIMGRNILIENLSVRTFDDRDIQYWDAVDGYADLYIYRAHSFFTNPLYFGTFSAMIAPYAIIKFVHEENLKKRLYFLFASLFCIGGVVLTFSRGPMMGLFLTLITLSIYVKPLRKILSFFVLILILASVLAWPWIGSKIMDRFMDTDNVSIRFKLWESATYMYLDNPVFGVGPGGFPEHQLETIRRHQVGPFTEQDGAHLEKVRTADSLYFQMAAEIGTIGILSYALKYIIALWMGIRIIKTATTRRIYLLSISASGGMMAYLLNGLTITAYNGYSITIVQELFLAFIAILYLLNTQQKT